MPLHDIDKKDFSEQIKSLRLEKKLTQKQMAENLNINERTYQHIESGKYSPSYKTTLAIIQSFGMEEYNKLIRIPDDFDRPKNSAQQ